VTAQFQLHFDNISGLIIHILYFLSKAKVFRYSKLSRQNRSRTKFCLWHN